MSVFSVLVNLIPYLIKIFLDLCPLIYGYRACKLLIHAVFIAILDHPVRHYSRLRKFSIGVDVLIVMFPITINLAFSSHCVVEDVCVGEADAVWSSVL